MHDVLGSGHVVVFSQFLGCFSAVGRDFLFWSVSSFHYVPIFSCVFIFIFVLSYLVLSRVGQATAYTPSLSKNGFSFIVPAFFHGGIIWNGAAVDRPGWISSCSSGWPRPRGRSFFIFVFVVVGLHLSAGLMEGLSFAWLDFVPSSSVCVFFSIIIIVVFVSPSL